MTLTVFSWWCLHSQPMTCRTSFGLVILLRWLAHKLKCTMNDFNSSWTFTKMTMLHGSCLKDTKTMGWLSNRWLWSNHCLQIHHKTQMIKTWDLFRFKRVEEGSLKLLRSLSIRMLSTIWDSGRAYFSQSGKKSGAQGGTYNNPILPSLTHFKNSLLINSHRIFLILRRKVLTL